MTSPDNDNLARIIEAAAKPVAQPCPDWHPGIDGLDPSDEMNIRRALWQGLKQPIVVPWLEGLRIRLLPGNELSRIIYLAGQFEPNEFWWLKRFLKPGMNIIDVGANMGTYSLFSAALVGAGGRVVAIEPSEREHDWLIDNVRLNGLENVSCIKAAAAAGLGTGRLKVASNWNSGHNTLGNYGYEATEHLADEDVVLTTLDAVVDDCGLARVDFIKMDIEGAELAALQGASATLRQHRPVLLVEIADRTLRHQGASSVDVVDFLHDHGYRMFRFDAPRRRLVPAVRKESYDSENLFAIPLGAEIPIAYDVTADTGGGAEAGWNLKWMETPLVVTPLPEPSGWRQEWHGYHMMEKVHSRSFVQALKASHSQTGIANAIQEGDIEQQALLNILADSLNPHLNMVELGAGCGDRSLALAGVLDHGLLGGPKRTYRCVAVEAEPIHYGWVKEHFEKQNIRGEAIWGAVYSHNGECWLAAPDLPENHYGQSIHATEGNVRVPCYTLREIMVRSGLDRIDIIHMDIQGAEMDVILDSLDLFAAGLIRYVIIGTHDPEFNSRIRALLGDYMTFHIDVPTYAGFDMTPFGIANFPVDGILLGRSKVPDPSANGQTIHIDTLVSVPRPLSPALSKSMPFGHLELTVQDELAAGRELNAVRLIRRWAAQRATVVRDERYATLENPRAPEEYIAGYENLTIMGACNQTADFLAQLYDRFGFPSATLGAGLQGQLSHAVTLVDVRHEGREVTMIQDAYINAEFALEGEEPTSFSRLLLATILDPDGIRLANHFPQDRRQKILYSQKEWEIMTAVPMFDGDDWLHMESKRAARQYLAFRLNKAEERVIPADMFLFPLYITGYRSSPHLMREITFYRHMAPYLTQSLAEFGRDAVIETLNSQEAVGLI